MSKQTDSDPAVLGRGTDEERYRYERDAMQIVQAIKDDIATAIDTNDGGEILGWILDLCVKVQQEAAAPLVAPAGVPEPRLGPAKGIVDKCWLQMANGEYRGNEVQAAYRIADEAYQLGYQAAAVGRLPALEALRPFLKHADNCDAITGRYSPGGGGNFPCSCGLESVLADLPVHDACICCPEPVRGLFAVAFNLLNLRSDPDRRKRKITERLDELQAAVTALQPFMDAHFKEREHSHNAALESARQPQVVAGLRADPAPLQLIENEEDTVSRVDHQRSLPSPGTTAKISNGDE